MNDHTPSGSRRGFLRGVLLAGTAGALAPLAVAEGLVSAESPIAMIDDAVDVHVPKHIIETIIPDLLARINAHHHLFGEPPRALFVNRFELRALALALTPVTRYSNSGLERRGVPNLMLKNIPVVSVDNDTIQIGAKS